MHLQCSLCSARMMRLKGLFIKRLTHICLQYLHRNGLGEYNKQLITVYNFNNAGVVMLCFDLKNWSLKYFECYDK